ncbi:c-type cytochrome [Primorskyibacter sp. S87]|uniref:c-type cytochrome n=1 Tax=Primorskyibacter sp. S87 TaxID=3415126 RepID=UPI003C7CE193
MRYVLVVSGFAVIAAVTWYLLRETAPAGVLSYQNSKVVSRGHALYDEFCASCHGQDLEGEPNWRQMDEDGYLPAPPHDASGHTWHHPDEQLVRITSYGSEAIIGGGYKSRMPGFADQMSREDIVAVLSFIKSTWPQSIIERHNSINLSAADG